MANVGKYLTYLYEHHYEKNLFNNQFGNFNEFVCHKSEEIWTEIVRVMSTQKAVTTEATNAMSNRVRMRLCSEPTKAAESIYWMLNYKSKPFNRMRMDKFCSTQQ